jgi:hypothetical protein
VLANSLVGVRACDPGPLETFLIRFAPAAWRSGGLYVFLRCCEGPSPLDSFREE